MLLYTKQCQLWQTTSESTLNYARKYVPVITKIMPKYANETGSSLA